MRVILATPATVMGGVWRHILDLAGALRERGIDVAIAVGEEVAPDLRERAASRAPIVAGPITEADIWHLHLADTYDPAALRLLARASRTSRRRVITEHLPRTIASDVSLMQRPARPGSRAAKTAMKRLHFSLSSAVIAVSDASARFMADRYSLSVERFTVIPNGIEPSRRAPAGPADAPRFVAVGSVIAQKGFGVLVEASRLAHTPWTVQVVGEGPQRTELQRAAAAAGGAVTFSGWSENPALAVDAALAVVMPSLWEALPYAALEAMDRGRAVVGSAVDGLVDVLGSSGAGVLVPPGDPARLARALDDLAGDQPRAAEMGRRGRQAVAEQFTLSGMAEETGALYDSLLRTAV
jgi:glycosyltransferase involved in cell wall biosynthesis